jgi:hypothetical protein
MITNNHIKAEAVNMQKQTMEFATVSKSGIVQKIGKGIILQPEIKFKGGSIKWHKDKLKSK